MIRKVGVVGAGIMGHGIAELIAVSGYEVTILDVNQEILDHAIEKIRWSLEQLEKTGRLKGSSKEVMARLKVTTRYNLLSESDLVLEAVKEDTKIKSSVYANLKKTVREDAIIASNTSTIPITELAALYGREQNFVGIHFSNPPILMPVVEIIKGERTSQEVLENCKEFVESLGKEIVQVEKDVPGFLINRLNDRTILEAMTILEDGCTPEILDSMIRFRLSFPMGMCELLDFVGIDTVFNANREMVGRGFDSRSSPILEEMVKQGKIGSKSGSGFYKYDGKGGYSRPQIMPLPEMFSIDPLRILAPAINEAAWLLRNQVCSRVDIEKALKLAMNWPHGPLEYADIYGIDNVVRILKERMDKSGETRYGPDGLLLEMLKENKLGQKTGEGFTKWDHQSRVFGSVIYTQVKNFALVEFNRPDKLNSLDEATWQGLKEALDYAASDQKIRCVVLTGKGKAFCAGDDIAMMESWKEEGDAGAWMQRYAEPLLATLGSYDKPLISAVNGIAFGGGCELNILFDIVIADASSIFAIPEGLIGAMPPIATSLGYALINRKVARYALTGEWFTAEEARDMGLVDVVVPSGQLNSAIVEFASKVAKTAPLSSQSIKTVVNKIRKTLANESTFASTELVRLASTTDFKEGQRAFLSRKAPNWEGR